MLRKSCFVRDSRIDINRGVEPRFLFVSELDLFLLDCSPVQFCCEVLFIIISIGLVPVLNRGSASLDAEPLIHTSTFRQRGSSGMDGARQPDSRVGVRVRSLSKIHIRELVRSTWGSLKSIPTSLKELFSVQPSSTHCDDLFDR